MRALSIGKALFVRSIDMLPSFTKGVKPSDFWVKPNQASS